jgi:hypothetical protein
MSTSHIHLQQLGYDRLDAHVRALDLSPFDDRQSVIAAGAPDLLPRLQSVYRAVRPILSILAELPLLPPHWRDALRLFIATVDAVAAAGGLPSEVPAGGTVEAPAGGTVPKQPAPDFKAGKDL